MTTDQDLETGKTLRPIDYKRGLTAWRHRGMDGGAGSKDSFKRKTESGNWLSALFWAQYIAWDTRGTGSN